MSQPDKNIGQGLFGSWQQDFLASLVVFLVALPLCMGIALASGAPVATGLVTGIIGGIIVGSLAGAPLQVSGPAAGLTVVCAGVISQYGIPALGIVVLIAGILQLLAGIFRLGQWFRAVSPSVVHGMLSGIGVLILASQFHVMMDHHPHGHGLENIKTIPRSLMDGLPIPEWETPEVRRSRIELIQAMGQVHEHQDEIERSIARVVTVRGSKALHDYEEQQLPSFAPAQQKVIEAFDAVVKKYRASPLAQADGPRAATLADSFAKAETALQAASTDLAAHQLEDAETSQRAASGALTDVMDNLKSHRWAGKVGLLAVLILMLWNGFAKGRLKLLPAPLLAVVATTLCAYAFSLPVLYVEVPDSLQNGLTFPTWTVFEDAPVWDLFVAGVVMAIVASAETLLCATAVDQMHDGPRTQYDRELSAQGIGNMLCGLVGALPMTGVIVRSASNVHAGAKSRLSAILHGTWLLIFVLMLSPVLRMIPIAALAGILVYTGFKLINFKGFLKLWKESRSEAFIFLATLVVIVVDHLLTGVVVGIVLSAVKLLVTFSHLEVRLQTKGHDQVTLSVAGAATFLRLPILAATLEKVPKGAHLHVDFEHLDYIDHACLELLLSWAKQHESSGGSLVIDWGELHARFHGPRRTNGNKNSGSKADRAQEPAHSSV